MSPLDATKQEAFAHKALGDVSGMQSVMLAALGDRLGLFKDLAANGSSTSAELASRTNTDERYVREWLGGMATGGYLEYDPATERFTLPAEHEAVLSDEGGPFFFGGTYQMTPRMLGVFDRVAEVFQTGGGVKQSEYHPELWDGLERFTGGWFENLLCQQWVPAMPDVEAKLNAGATMADVGCGRGRALIKLAEAFPSSRFVGFDAFEPTVALATERAKEAGVADRVSFEHLDGGTGLPEKFDVIATFDVVHDAVDPLGLLKGIRQSLKDDGIYVCLDMNSSHKLEENVNPLGALFHGFSVFYCMTTSLAHGGEGLGTLGFHEVKVNELCSEAGFSTVRRLPLENPFNIVYDVRP